MRVIGKKEKSIADWARWNENRPWGNRGGERVLTPITLLMTHLPTEHCSVCGSAKVLGRACSRCNF